MLENDSPPCASLGNNGGVKLDTRGDEECNSRKFGRVNHRLATADFSSSKAVDRGVGATHTRRKDDDVPVNSVPNWGRVQDVKDVGCRSKEISPSRDGDTENLLSISEPSKVNPVTVMVPSNPFAAALANAKGKGNPFAVVSSSLNYYATQRPEAVDYTCAVGAIGFNERSERADCGGAAGIIAEAEIPHKGKLPFPIVQECDEGSSANEGNRLSGCAAGVAIVNGAGTGEEGETRIFAVDPCKLYEMDGGAWKERGTGDLRLNRNSSDASRLVMRVKGSLRVVLNARLWPGMKATKMTEKSASFIAVNAIQSNVDDRNDYSQNISADKECFLEESSGRLSSFALKFKEVGLVEEFIKHVAENAHQSTVTEAVASP